MTHIMELFPPSKYVAAYELKGRDVTLTITRVVAEMIEGENNRKDKRPILYFEEAKKPFVLNKTNAKVLIKLYGADHTKWPGRRLTIFPTTTKMAGETVECIRVRAVVPPAKKGDSRPSAIAPDEPPPPSDSSEPDPMYPDDIAAQVADLSAAMRSANSQAGLALIWKNAIPLRNALERESAEQLDNLLLIYESRQTDLEAAAKERK